MSYNKTRKNIQKRVHLPYTIHGSAPNLQAHPCACMMLSQAPQNLPCWGSAPNPEVFLQQWNSGATERRIRHHSANSDDFHTELAFREKTALRASQAL